MLTEDDLAAIERIEPGIHFPVDVHALDPFVAEVRRLHSDEWLEKAAEEIAESAQLIGGYGDVLAILRKHRDGMA